MHFLFLYNDVIYRTHMAKWSHCHTMTHDTSPKTTARSHHDSHQCGSNFQELWLWWAVAFRVSSLLIWRTQSRSLYAREITHTMCLCVVTRTYCVCTWHDGSSKGPFARRLFYQNRDVQGLMGAVTLCEMHSKGLVQGGVHKRNLCVCVYGLAMADTNVQASFVHAPVCIIMHAVMV